MAPEFFVFENRHICLACRNKPIVAILYRTFSPYLQLFKSDLKTSNLNTKR
jgi:hypothetical protein